MADMMRTTNPALNERAFQDARSITGESMTLQGTVNKAGVLRLSLRPNCSHREIPPWRGRCDRWHRAFLYLQIVLRFFGVHFTAINGGGAIGIGFSIFVVIIAALNLVLDFDLIENGVRIGAPKYMEWYSAFALMITLIWLYFEILNLLSKLRSRD